MPLRCESFDGRCCGSCHDEVEDGFGELQEVYDNAGNLYALVCCGKCDEANKRAASIG